MISSQDVLYSSLGLGAFFWVLFSIRRQGPAPTQLNLRAQSGEGLSYRKGSKIVTISPETLQSQGISSRERSLNVSFIYNGHSFEAHEVLGLPAGARLQMIEEAYKKEITRQAPQSREFIETAYRALIERNRKSSIS